MSNTIEICYLVKVSKILTPINCGILIGFYDVFFTLRKRANIFILLETYIHEESKAIQFRLNFINMMIVYIFGFLNLMLELLQLWTLNHPHRTIINSFIYLEFSMKIFFDI